jgi:hypothetical protein
VCNALGHIIDELQLQRGTGERILLELRATPEKLERRLLAKLQEEQERDLEKVNERLSVLERFMRRVRPA